MKVVLSSLAATWVTLPIIGYVLFFIVAKQMTKSHRRSVKLAMDLSTIPFIFSVYYLIIVIWDKQVFWIIMLVILFIACAVVLAQYKVKQEIVFVHVLRGFWRVNFAFFLFMYLFLFMYGLFSRISSMLI